MIFIGILVDNAVHVIRMAPIIPCCPVIGDGRGVADRFGVGIPYTVKDDRLRPRRSLLCGLEWSCVTAVSESFTTPRDRSSTNPLKNVISILGCEQSGVGILYTSPIERPLLRHNR